MPKIALVLAGGGSRGLAHIGVLEVLAREKIPIDLIVATSMGAIVGTFFALGYSPQEIGVGMRQIQPQLVILSLSAWARQRRLLSRLRAVIGERTFADLQIPMIMMAVDMAQGTEVELSAGPLLPAILASSAVPGAFPPIQHEGRYLADGGVIDCLATHVAFAHGAEKVIAVDVYPPLDNDNPWVNPLSAITGFQLPGPFLNKINLRNKTMPTAAAALWRSVRIMTWYLHQKRLTEYPPHILLQPSVAQYGVFDFKDMEGIQRAGVVAAEAKLAEIKALVID